jgi:hypothetical protein
VSVRLPLAFLLGVATAALVACGGGSNDKLIPSVPSSRIQNDLDALRSALGQHDCAAADQALTKLKQDVANLPSSVDARLRRRLRVGTARLSVRVPIDCAQQTTTTQTNTTPTTDTTTTPTTDTTQTTTTPPPTTTTTPPPTTTTTPPPTDTTGGVTAP